MTASKRYKAKPKKVKRRGQRIEEIEVLAARGVKRERRGDEQRGLCTREEGRTRQFQDRDRERGSGGRSNEPSDSSAVTDRKGERGEKNVSKSREGLKVCEKEQRRNSLLSKILVNSLAIAGFSLSSLSQESTSSFQR